MHLYLGNLTALVTDYRWEDTVTTDRHRTLQFYQDDTLCQQGAKELAEALLFGSQRSLLKFLERSRKRGYIGGEIGNLTRPCVWLAECMEGLK